MSFTWYSIQNIGTIISNLKFVENLHKTFKKALCSINYFGSNLPTGKSLYTPTSIYLREYKIFLPCNNEENFCRTINTAHSDRLLKLPCSRTSFLQSHIWKIQMKFKFWHIRAFYMLAINLSQILLAVILGAVSSVIPGAAEPSHAVIFPVALCLFWQLRSLHPRNEARTSVSNGS